MQHNDDLSQRLKEFLITAISELEILMSHKRFSSSKIIYDQDITDAGFNGIDQMFSNHEYVEIANLHKRFKEYLTNIHSINLNAVQVEITKTQKNLVGLDERYLHKYKENARDLLINLAQSATSVENHKLSTDSSSTILSAMKEHDRISEKPALPRRKEKPTTIEESQTFALSPPPLPPRKERSTTIELSNAKILALRIFLNSHIDELKSYRDKRRNEINEVEKVDPDIYHRKDGKYETYKAILTKEKCNAINELIASLSEFSKQLHDNSDYETSLSKIMEIVGKTERKLRRSLSSANARKDKFKTGDSEKLVTAMMISAVNLKNEYSTNNTKKTNEKDNKVNDYKPHNQL